MMTIASALLTLEARAATRDQMDSLEALWGSASVESEEDGPTEGATDDQIRAPLTRLANETEDSDILEDIRTVFWEFSL